ncbi:cell division septation protein DedD [Paraburkholderia sp. GAS199]
MQLVRQFILRSIMFTTFSKVTATSLFGLLTLAACSSTPQPKFQQELFETGASPYARNFNSSTTDTCEAARRALLSQGYLTTMTRTDTVDGTKNFQPTGDTHVVVEFHVVCTPGEEASDTSIVYVNAVQNGFALKKSDTSASVGLSVLGSLSLPIRSNSDAMVKISSETIPSGKFYDRFFGLIDHYLQTVVRTQPVANSRVETRLLPMPVEITVPAPVPAMPDAIGQAAAIQPASSPTVSPIVSP